MGFIFNSSFYAPYLRDPNDCSVRLAILEEIKKGFNKNRNRETSWSKFNLNLSHSKYTHEFNLDEIKYDGNLILTDVIVYESITIKNAEILGKLNLNVVNISGSLDATGIYTKEGTQADSVTVAGGSMKLGGDLIIN